jgi:cytochrome b561
LVLAWSFDFMAPDWLRNLVDIHKSIGLAVLGLAIMRPLWRATHTPPPPLHAGPAWEHGAAHAAHWILYGLIFLLPISGWMHDSAWKGAIEHPMKWFFIIPWFRFGAIDHVTPAAKEHLHSRPLAHVAGALKHQFLQGMPELQRMWPATRRTPIARPLPAPPTLGAAPTGAWPEPEGHMIPTALNADS